MHDDYLLVIGDVDEQLLPYLCFCTTGCSEAEWAGHVARIAPRQPQPTWEYWGVKRAEVWGRILIPKWDVVDLTEDDTLRKGELDFQRMRESARASGLEAVERLEKLTDGTPPAQSWVEVLATFGRENIEAAQEFYCRQPRVAAVERKLSRRWVDAALSMSTDELLA